MTEQACERTFPVHNSVVARHEFSRRIRQYCRRAGAANYLIAEVAPGGGSGSVRILSSDWTFDIIEDLGITAIARLCESSVATLPGARPCGWHPKALAALLACNEIARLESHGQRELYLLALPVGKQHFAAIVSAHAPGQADHINLSRMQIAFCHLLSGFKTAEIAPSDLLSERERECLQWVSEGKTADEISLILDVSINTVNSHVSQAVHRLSAKNRAMAISTAIRRELI